MKGYDATTFGDRMVHYDTLDWALEDDEEAASDFLASLARGGAALELGIGTGRVAIPLARKGSKVSGVEASESMAGQLRQKLADTAINVIIGDFACEPSAGEYALVYCVNSTFFLLRTQQEQVSCFRNVAARLLPGGSFVLQTLHPDRPQMVERSNVSCLVVDLNRAVLSMSTHDPATQQVDSQRLVFTKDQTRMYPMAYRYAWPAELDLMAQLVGLRLAGRWNAWAGERFTASGNYVSLYRKP